MFVFFFFLAIQHAAGSLTVIFLLKYCNKSFEDSHSFIESELE